ncbi:MAG: 50S ribosomal protein L22, partial [Vicinamibacterales bacterium]
RGERRGPGGGCDPDEADRGQGMIEAHATARYVRTSAQKAGLVLDLIRGRNVNEALATLRFARKSVARDVEKVLRSAIANAQQKDGFTGDVDTLYVAACYAGQGPSMKRVRPAPMGRAFRVVKRTAHLTVRVAERASEASAARVETGDKKPQGARAGGSAAPKTRSTRTGRSATAKTRGKSPARRQAGAKTKKTTSR